jgi:hypothetical protein
MNNTFFKEMDMTSESPSGLHVVNNNIDAVGTGVAELSSSVSPDNLEQINQLVSQPVLKPQVQPSTPVQMKMPTPVVTQTQQPKTVSFVQNTSMPTRQPPLKPALKQAPVEPQQESVKSELINVQNKIESGNTNNSNTTKEQVQENIQIQESLPAHLIKIGKFKAPKQTLLLFIVLVLLGGGLFYLTREKKEVKVNKDDEKNKNK